MGGVSSYNMGDAPASTYPVMNDSELDKTLLSAEDDALLPSDFRRQVWLRIESSSAANSGLASWFEKAFSSLVKPAVAAVAILTTTAIGLGLGAHTAPQPEGGKEAYVRSVNPFASPHNR